MPGELIPGMYLDYLRTGDATDMARVIYHNAVDILSLVRLSSAVLERFQQPNPSGLEAGEALAVARWHESAGRLPEAEEAYLAAVEAAPRAELRVEALRSLSAMLKRQKRRSEAVPHWKRWGNSAPEDPVPLIELAMYYEWEAKDLPAAHKCSEHALIMVASWPKGWRRDQRIAEIQHRINRLNKKKNS